jgi:hypothetical protein
MVFDCFKDDPLRGGPFACDGDIPSPEAKLERVRLGREQSEVETVEREAKNLDVVAIYSEIVQNPKGDAFLVYSIILREPPVGRTAEEMIESCRERRARPLFRRYFDEEDKV